MTISLIRAKYGVHYTEITGKLLRSLPNTLAIYSLFGDIDFLVIFLCKNIDEYTKITDKLTEIESVERSDSRIVSRQIKDYDFRNLRIDNEL